MVLAVSIEKTALEKRKEFEMRYFNNALPGALIPVGIIKKTTLTLEQAKAWLADIPELHLGHAQTCVFAEKDLGRKVTLDRANLPPFHQGDAILVYQMYGKRVAEGVYELPEGTEYRFELYEFL